MIVEAAPVISGPRAADRNIAANAAEDGGVYRPSRHLERIRDSFERQRKDPEAFIRSHVRRLEAPRRAGHDPIRNDGLHFAKRCVRIVENGQTARAEFEDGTYAEGDILVGADGIHSVVHEHLFGNERPRFSGNIAHRGLLPAGRVAGLGIEFKSTNWIGPGGQFVHYYVSSGRYLNFVAVTEQSNWTRES